MHGGGVVLEMKIQISRMWFNFADETMRGVSICGVEIRVYVQQILKKYCDSDIRCNAGTFRQEGEDVRCCLIGYDYSFLASFALNQRYRRLTARIV